MKPKEDSMELFGFRFAEDTIGIECGGKYFDMHNCFDFKGLEYDVIARRLILNWKKGEGKWVEENLPKEVGLEFQEVYLFKAKERDPSIPFTEDDCVESMSFIHNDLIDEMNGILTNIPSGEVNHLIISFMSGFSMKIAAKSARLRVV
jgi:hypothetical protein